MRHDQEAIQELLAGLPLNERLAHLALSLLVEDKPAVSIENLLEVAVIMSRHLPKSQRFAVVWHLNAATEELGLRARDFN